ncbi:MAG: hypothetical protein M3P10_03290, partial [Actinomycetota bacterium]|nr:hypothetical protein [Actinomycetota bacterium]
MRGAGPSNWPAWVPRNGWPRDSWRPNAAGRWLRGAARSWSSTAIVMAFTNLADEGLNGGVVVGMPADPAGT